MVLVPAATMVTVFPVIVATAGLLLLNVNAPGPLLLGAVITNGASPSTLFMAGKAPRVGPPPPPHAARHIANISANGKTNLNFMGDLPVTSKIAR